MRDFVVRAAVFQAVLLFFFATILILQLSSEKEYSFLDFFPKVSLKSMHECRKYQPFAEPTASGKKYLKNTLAQGDTTAVTAWGEMC